MRVTFRISKDEALKKYPSFLHHPDSAAPSASLPVAAVYVYREKTEVFVLIPGDFLPTAILFSDIDIVNSETPRNWQCVIHKDLALMIFSFPEWAKNASFYYRLSEGCESESVVLEREMS